MQDLLAAYKEAEQKRQTITIQDEAKGYWAYLWLYWDILADSATFPWKAIPEEELPWGFLPDKVIEGKIQPGEWTE